MRTSILALIVFIGLRLLVLPSQISHTPYHDDTVGEELFRLVFWRVPFWIYAISGFVFVLGFGIEKAADEKVRARRASRNPPT